MTDSDRLLGPPQSLTQWVALVRSHLDDGQYFLAHDIAADAAERHPEALEPTLLAALALLRSGAVNQARKALAPVMERIQDTGALARDGLNRLRRLAGGGGLDAGAADDLMALAHDLVRLAGRRAGGDADLEASGIIGDVFLELWKRGGDRRDLVTARDAYDARFRGTGDPGAGVDAAMLTWFGGEPERAGTLARDVLDAMDRRHGAADGQARVRWLTTMAEACVLADPQRAEAIYREALGERHYSWVAQAVRRLRQMRAHGVPVPEAALAVLRPPTVVVFGGQPIDHPHDSGGFFPAEIEQTVAQAIRQRLDSLGADVGYCSAASGSDILFIEAMIERGAEVHVFLPFDAEDFVRARVAYAGGGWQRRFRTALRLAASVNQATEQPYLGHDVLLRFNNRLIEGMARLRADFLCTEPQLMLVWHYGAANNAGTAADFMDHWPDMTRLHLIDLDDLRGDRPPPQPAQAAASAPRQEPQRVIRSMLFADIAGFSRLGDAHLPRLWDMLAAARQRIEAEAGTPGLVESWGDALYIVMDDTRRLLRYAFALQRSFVELDAADFGLPFALNIRMGLHAGPVYEGRHPLTHRPIVYGSHVSRAARIEPITVKGEIYASHQFVALLTTEQRALLHECQLTGKPYAEWFACEYVGTLALAKNYGLQPVYHLRPLEAAPPSP